MNRVIKVLLFLFSLLFFVSCVSKKHLNDNYYFQALGKEQAIVVTLDAQKGLKEFFAIEDALLERVERLSIELYKEDYQQEEEFLDSSDLQNYSYRGAIEGRFPKLITNTVLLKDSNWTKVEYEEALRSYRNEELGIEVYAPKKNLILFTNDNYVELYNSTYKNREVKIELPLANQMANALFGLYLASPQAMLDIGLPIPKSALLQCDSIMLYVNYKDDENLYLGGTITLKSERLARSLSILLKSSYISEKRRNKEPLGDLTGLFTLEDNKLLIDKLPLSEQDYQKISSLFNNLSHLL